MLRKILLNEARSKKVESKITHMLEMVIIAKQSSTTIIIFSRFLYKRHNRIGKQMKNISEKGSKVENRYRNCHFSANAV